MVDVDKGEIELIAEVRTPGPTGFDMEALTAASVAALTVYDMIKGIERGAEIASIVLLYKAGGRSGEWRRPSWSSRLQATAASGLPAPSPAGRYPDALDANRNLDRPDVGARRADRGPLRYRPSRSCRGRRCSDH